MKLRTLCLVAATVLAGSLSMRAASPLDVSRSAALPRYAEGAPPGFSGGSGEQSCHACHFEAEINQKPGLLTVTGVPERFTPGERYTLTVSLTRPGLKLGGFQLAARLDNGAQAGTLTAPPDNAGRIGIESQGGIQYASQRRPGATPVAADTTRWTVLWQAPAAPAQAVQVHVAANAADGDESVRGDYIYTTVLKTSPQ